jgi:hypothetical protein
MMTIPGTSCESKIICGARLFPTRPFMESVMRARYSMETCKSKAVSIEPVVRARLYL